MNEGLQHLRTADEIAADDRVARFERLRPYILDPREDYPEPYYMFEFNGVPFSTLGGLQAMTGQKKNGKTFVLTQLMAAALADDNERSRMFLGSLQVPQRTIDYLGHRPTVLSVDTEMEKLNSAKVLRRVHWLCGWDMKEPNERFNQLWLKGVKKDEETGEQAYDIRYKLIKDAIDLLNPDLVIIDGMRDIISTINDEVTTVSLLSELSNLADERHMSIWLALHQNPSSNEDTKMRGWSGTELGNKVSDTFVSIKDKSANGVTFTVKQIDARGKDVDDWKFEVTDDAGNLGVPRIINNPGDSKRTAPEHDTLEDIRKWINEATLKYEWPMDRKSIKQLVFAEIGGVKNTGKQQADLQVALEMKYLVESTIKANRSNSYMLMPPEDLPF